MATDEPPARSPRLSEADTVERMLDKGAELVAEVGLRIVVDTVSIEEIIDEAKVSRAAVYRHWPSREQYFSDLMLRLASRANPASAALDEGTTVAVLEVAQRHPHLFATPEGRQRLLVEMCRVGSQVNFDTLRLRGDWRIYVALHSALLAMPESDFRDELKRTLADSSTVFVGKMSALLEALLGLLGYRIRPALGELRPADFALIGASVVEGSVLMAGATDAVADLRLEIDPFGVGETRSWSQVSLAYTSLAVVCSEPDPSIEWTPERLSDTTELVRALSAEFTSLSG